jgi:Icc-related predicted phosphoesterase
MMSLAIMANNESSSLTLQNLKSLSSLDPTILWKELQSNYICKELDSTELILSQIPLTAAAATTHRNIDEKDNDFIRCLALSDSHNFHFLFKHKFPSIDILIHAGDFTMEGGIAELLDFNKFLLNFPAETHKIIVTGNHELTLDPQNKHYNGNSLQILSANVQNLHYLVDSSIDLFGYEFYGSPFIPSINLNDEWAFSLPRGCDELNSKWLNIPAGVDILITHTPPLGYGDFDKITKEHCGDYALLQCVTKKVKPKFHIFGHIHEGYGAQTDGLTNYLNVASCKWNYNPNKLNRPIVFDLPKR